MVTRADTPIAEHELREALRFHLGAMLHDDAKVVEELGIENGSARIDVAVIAEYMAGYEIKSDFDTPGRLYNQIHAYNRVFDQIYIVTGPVSGKEIHNLLPSWWGILHGMRNPDGSVLLTELRQPSSNHGRDPYSLLTLLKREELNQLAAKHQLPNKIIKGNKPALLELLAASIPLDVITTFVTETLRCRLSLSTAVQ